MTTATFERAAAQPPQDAERPYRRWEPAPFGTRGTAEPALELEQRRRQAAEEGYAAGQRAGMAAAQGVLERLAALLAASEQGLRLMEERLAGELLDLAIDLARHVIRGEVTARREALLPLAREALGMLAQQARAVQVLVHPADAALLRKHLAEEIDSGGWRIVEDHRIEPGGLRVHSSAGDIDATLATRWRRVLASIGQDHEWHEPAE